MVERVEKYVIAFKEEEGTALFGLESGLPQFSTICPTTCWTAAHTDEDKNGAYRTVISKGTCRPQFRANPSRRAFKAVVDLEEEDENPDDDGEYSEFDSYACVAVLKEEEFEFVDEQNVLSCQQVGTSRTSRSLKSAALAYTTKRQHARDMGVPGSSSFVRAADRRTMTEGRAAVRRAAGQEMTSALLARVVPRGKAKAVPKAKVSRTSDVQKYTQAPRETNGNVWKATRECETNAGPEMARIGAVPGTRKTHYHTVAVPDTSTTRENIIVVVPGPSIARQQHRCRIRHELDTQDRYRSRHDQRNEDDQPNDVFRQLSISLISPTMVQTKMMNRTPTIRIRKQFTLVSSRARNVRTTS